MLKFAQMFADLQPNSCAHLQAHLRHRSGQDYNRAFTGLLTSRFYVVTLQSK